MKIKLRGTLLVTGGAAFLSVASVAAAQSATAQDHPPVIAFEDPRVLSLRFWSATPAARTIEISASNDTLTGPSEPSPIALGKPQDVTLEPGIRATRPFQSLGVGFTAGLSGLGIDLATPMADRYNLRIGASFLGFSAIFHEQGVPVQGTIHLASARVVVDYAPKGKSFHISPGVNVYNRDHYRASVNISGSQTIIFNGVSYISDPNSPITGEAVVRLANRPAPRLTVGWGNMIRHRTPPNFTFPFELGVEYINAPTLHLHFGGSTCNSRGVCTPIVADPSTQQNIADEEKNVTNDLRPLRFFPIVSFGISYKFGH